jgi:hypothetical protein
MDATCDDACKELDKKKEKIERDLARDTDPTAKIWLKKELELVEAKRDEIFAARDRLYQELPPQEAKPSGPVARKPRRSFSQWVEKLFKREGSPKI